MLDQVYNIDDRLYFRDPDKYARQIEKRNNIVKGLQTHDQLQRKTPVYTPMEQTGKLSMCPHSRTISTTIPFIGTVQMVVPCGKCDYCLHKKQNAWIFRARNQFRYSNHSFFITLTYAPEFLPQPEPENNFTYGVQKRDVQLFLKRFRKNNPKLCFSYFCRAEYGPDTGRPHYHLNLFFQNRYIDPNRLLQSLKDCWHQGFVTMSKLTVNRIAYSTKYMQKISYHMENEEAKNITYGIPVHFLNKEFILVSKHFGEAYINDNFNQIRDRLTASYHNMTKYGKYKEYVVPYPKYYTNKVFDDCDKWLNCYNYLKSDVYKDRLNMLESPKRKKYLKQLGENYHYQSEQKIIENLHNRYL